MRALPGICLASLSLLLPLRGSAEPAVALVLLDDSAAPAVSARSFALAFSIQLQALKVELRQQRWRPAALPGAQLQEAMRRARAAAADFAVWYLQEPGDGSSEVLVFLLQLQHESPTTRFMSLGPPHEGIERAMAMTLKTMISAAISGSDPVGEPVRLSAPTPAVSAPTTQPAPTPPPETPPAAPAPVVARSAPAPVSETTPPDLPGEEARPAPRASLARITVAGGYGLGLLPLGEELRHGPFGRLDLRLWRRFSGRLEVGWDLPRSAALATSTWSRQVLNLAAGVTHSWPFSSRWELNLGGELRLANVRVQATAPEDRQETASLWELGLGPTAGAAWKVHDLLAVELKLAVAWLPVGHQLLIAGSRAAESGGLLIALQSGARFWLW